MPRALHRFLAAVAGSLALAPLVAQPAPRETDLVERARSRVYRLRLRLEPAWFAEEDRCLDLTAGELRVKVRGARLTDPAQWQLEREPEPAIHALLVDGSRSMIGRLERVREAASLYLEWLEPDHERGFVAAFDETPALLRGVTADRPQLIEAVEGIRLGGVTSLYDALTDALRELALYRDRPVLLLLSDGIDEGSLHNRDDVYDLLGARSDLTVFSVGLGLPELTTTGPPGLLSTRKFLQRLAYETHGEFFDVPTTSRLERAYRRIRGMLDAEATLVVVDPDPDAEPGKVTVASLRNGCTVRVVRGADETARPVADAPLAGPRFQVAADPVLLNPYRVLRVHTSEPGCEEASELELQGDRITGCVLDVTMDYGLLYDPFPRGRTAGNEWLRIRNRAIHIPLPAASALPRAPEELFDRLAAQALALAGTPIDVDPRRRPAAEHARPHYDMPQLVSDRVFFDLRPAIAQALYTRGDYRAYADAARRAETQRELERLRRRLRAHAPESSDEELQRVLDQSEAAREIRARATEPTVADLERHLAAWLGDVPVHDVFVRWEQRHVLQLLAGDASDAGFVPAWSALRRIFWLPSYSRMLTLLAPGLDAEGGRIGLWRLRLPRPSWIRERVKPQAYLPEFADVPLDLVPPLPFAYRVAQVLLDGDDGAPTALRAQRFVEARVRYELLGKQRTHDPLRAFRQTRVTLELVETDRSAALRVEADVELTGRGETPRMRIRRLELSGSDAELTAALQDAAGSIVERR